MQLQGKPIAKPVSKVADDSDEDESDDDEEEQKKPAAKTAPAKATPTKAVSDDGSCFAYFIVFISRVNQMLNQYPKSRTIVMMTNRMMTMNRPHH